MNRCRRSLCLALVLCTASLRAADTIYQTRERLDREYSQRLEQLAAWCDQQGLTDAARRTRAWLPADRDQRLLLFDPTQASKFAPDESDWGKRFRELRVPRAKELFGLAQQCERTDFSLATELAGGALREDPTHPAAQKALGFGNTTFVDTRQRARQVWHDRFGWLPEAHVARYEAGERYYKNRWISLEQDARYHSDIGTGWEVDTEHFSVVTNHSLEAAARFGRKLEQLHAAWLQVCGAYAATSFKALSADKSRRRHDVMVFRNRGEYLQALRGEVPDDVMTTGIYVPRRRTAYFFVPENDKANQPVFDDTVLFHEAVHQLFNETGQVVAAPGEKQNFWLIEGIACYFESLAERDGWLALGGVDAERIHAARFRLLNDNFYIPLAELCGMNRLAVQRDPRIARIYSQSSGLTHFLIHADRGSLRHGLFEALKAVYSGRDRASTLSGSLSQDYAELDNAYRAFMQRAE